VNFECFVLQLVWIRYSFISFSQWDILSVWPWAPLGTEDFYVRKQLLLSAHLSHRNSVRPSVCPSHRWISQKRCKLGSPNLHRRLPGRL